MHDSMSIQTQPTTSIIKPNSLEVGVVGTKSSVAGLQTAGANSTKSVSGVLVTANQAQPLLDALAQVIQS